MPTIILNKTTTNPNIPKVPVYGFYDSFDRPNADDLGVTSGELKPWVQLGNNIPTEHKFAIRSNMLGLTETGASTAITAVVDALKSDGTLETKPMGSTTGSLRMCFRTKDFKNFLGLFISPTSVAIRRYVDNAFTVAGSATVAATLGKVISIKMEGTSISVLIDGVQVIAPVTVTEYATETRHGVQAATVNGTTDRFEFMSFTPV